MPDATIEDYSELVGAVLLQDYPILPKPDWGQDAAFLAFYIDTMGAKLRELIRVIHHLLEHGPCPCGARIESPDTHPHVSGCPVGAALSG